MIKYSILLVLSIFCFQQGFAQTVNTDQEDMLLEKLMQEEPIVGIAAGYSFNGEHRWKEAKGYSNLEANTPFTETTLTRIASIAKPMTAIAIMQLVEKSLIDLDAPIQDYIQDFPSKSKTAITTRHLLAHTSGIDGYKSTKEAQNKIEYPRLKDAMKVFQDRDLKFEPGTAYSYTSYGYVVLGVIIENVSGLSFENYMQKNIWDKAGMSNTSIEKTGKNYPNKSALYHKKKKKVKFVKASKTNNLSNRVPGGGFQTTLNDLLKFGEAVLNNSLIKEETLKEMLAVSFDIEVGNPYGFGWVLYAQKPNYGTVFGHGGAQTGANTQILIKPETNTVVVILANTSGTGHLPTMLAVDLLRITNEL